MERQAGCHGCLGGWCFFMVRIQDFELLSFWIIYAFYYKIYGHSWHFTILCKHSWHFLRVLATWVFQKMHMNPDLEASVNVRRVLAFGRCSPVPFHSVGSHWGRPRPEQEVIILLRTLHLGWISMQHPLVLVVYVGVLAGVFFNWTPSSFKSPPSLRKFWRWHIQEDEWYH